MWNERENTLESLLYTTFRPFIYQYNGCPPDTFPLRYCLPLTIKIMGYVLRKQKQGHRLIMAYGPHKGKLSLSYALGHLRGHRDVQIDMEELFTAWPYEVHLDPVIEPPDNG